ncbi:hypothetical protein FSARC_8281 [Fusarium sarcochroum]|uniref:Uncharacterized protein n=1 Tax=Fusarium sarcochroum TaxID=1208366 RepID=A0A8H4TT77_9HYPO|nr:hypothetical protein FSARC_8281 [Fusarium sarcochroum]
MSRELFAAHIPHHENGQPKIKKLLIANRGEIACRIIATCRKLNVASIAVYTEEDALSRHVSDADESICIGAIRDSSTNPFLDVDLLVQTALDHGAQAIHPGYGYLSENASFADRTREAGLLFVGPTGAAMTALGDKRSSKEYLQQNAPDVPLIPGFSGKSQDVSDFEKAAVAMGFPVMLKASAGGGGKGMRVVHQAQQLRDELARVQSEAQRSFGSSDIILEKFVQNSKHVEVQIVGDQHGDVVSLYERDCSVQRRNQKVIEETPCLFLDPETKKHMCDVAVRIVKLIGYEGAGTVEFVFDTTEMKFYFLEVNTRLQVEHPITEEVVGLDIVSLQLYVAAGGRLSELPQTSNITQMGHAIECRLCAEDPQRDFFPDHDTIALWKPASGPERTRNSTVRYETAISTDSTVSIYFDSMICKVVVWAPTRAMAVERMAKELAQTACIGVKTNQLFLQSCLLHPEFQNLAYNTSFIPTHLEQLLRNPYNAQVPQGISIIPNVFLRTLHGQMTPFGNVTTRFRNQRLDPLSAPCDIISMRTSRKSALGDDTDVVRCDACLLEPAHIRRAGQNTNEQRFYVHPVENLADEQDERTRYDALSQALRKGNVWDNPSCSVRDVRITPVQGSYIDVSTPVELEMSVDGKKVRAFLVLDGHTSASGASLHHDTVRILAHVPQLGEWVQFQRDTMLSFFVNRRRDPEGLTQDKGKVVKAPMPCKILGINVAIGAECKAGDVVMVVESMKMEIAIAVGAAGAFTTRWKVGDAVEEGSVLCLVE